MMQKKLLENSPCIMRQAHAGCFVTLQNNQGEKKEVDDEKVKDYHETQI